LSTLRLDSLYGVLGNPESEELVRLDGKALDMGLPRYLVKAAEWDDWIDEDDEDLRILDLGEAFHQGAEPKHLAQPGALRVPETIFAASFDYRVDLWRAGCIVRTSV
jgi:serine/threonine-protein kinase SRPK3